MVKPSENQIVTWLRDERWLSKEFKLKRLESQQNVYRGSGRPRKADLVGIDRDKKVYAFEVKKERDIGSAFDQASAYSQGANFVYCVLEENSVSEESMKALEKTGIGLIVYRLEKGSPTGIRRAIGSIDHRGPYVERTRNLLTEGVPTQRCFVFPSADRESLLKLWTNSARTVEEELVGWDYNASVLPSTGSIIIFSSGGAFVGQGIAVKSRNATADDRKKGYKKSRVVFLWGKSILKYPREVRIDEVKDSIVAIRNLDRKMANYQIGYKPISPSEGQKIVLRALLFSGWTFERSIFRPPKDKE